MRVFFDSNLQESSDTQKVNNKVLHTYTYIKRWECNFTKQSKLNKNKIKLMDE